MAVPHLKMDSFKHASSALEHIVTRQGKRHHPVEKNDAMPLGYIGWQDDWSKLRISVAMVTSSRRFEFAMAAIVLLNIGLIFHETNLRAECDDRFSDACPANSLVLKMINFGFLGIYIVEIAIGVFVYRKKFFFSYWNNFDCFLVATGFTGEVVGGAFQHLAIVRLLRVTRLVKMIRVFYNVPELYIILNGFIHALKGVFWASLLMFLMLSVWSVFAVELLQPMTEDIVNSGAFEAIGSWRGPEAWENVMSANLTFLQAVIMGDGWGSIAIPYIQHNPWTIVFFIGNAATVAFVGCNLILAVIVEAATKCRDEDVEHQLKIKASREIQMKTEFVSLCHHMDRDGTGDLSMEELMDGYDNNETFRNTLKNMNVGREDLHIVFSIMDQDGSGAVNYKEFADELYKISCADEHTMIIFMNFHIQEIKQRLNNDMMAHADLIQRIRDDSVVHSKTLDEIRKLLSSTKREEPELGFQMEKNSDVNPWTAPPKPPSVPPLKSATEDLVGGGGGVDGSPSPHCVDFGKTVISKPVTGPEVERIIQKASVQVTDFNRTADEIIVGLAVTLRHASSLAVEAAKSTSCQEMPSLDTARIGSPPLISRHSNVWPTRQELEQGGRASEEQCSDTIGPLPRMPHQRHECTIMQGSCMPCRSVSVARSDKI